MTTKQELIDYWKNKNIITNENILKAFQEVKRENFVLLEYKDSAYEDVPLPIGHESTISQPTTIMIMLQALEIKENQKILEVGTGSGYTAALISRINTKGKIYSIDIIPEVIEFAKNNLKNIENIELFCKDGKQGLKEFAPFDRILINAACKEIPKELISQLKVNGILVAPIGPEYQQKMIKITKEKDKLKEEYLGDFVFVKLK